MHSIVRAVSDARLPRANSREAEALNRAIAGNWSNDGDDLVAYLLPQ